MALESQMADALARARTLLASPDEPTRLRGVHVLCAPAVALLPWLQGQQEPIARGQPAPGFGLGDGGSGPGASHKVLVLHCFPYDR